MVEQTCVAAEKRDGLRVVAESVVDVAKPALELERLALEHAKVRHDVACGGGGGGGGGALEGNQSGSCSFFYIRYQQWRQRPPRDQWRQRDLLLLLFRPQQTARRRGGHTRPVPGLMGMLRALASARIGLHHVSSHLRIAMKPAIMYPVVYETPWRPSTL